MLRYMDGASAPSRRQKRNCFPLSIVVFVLNDLSLGQKQQYFPPACCRIRMGTPIFPTAEIFTTLARVFRPQNMGCCRTRSKCRIAVAEYLVPSTRYMFRVSPNSISLHRQLKAPQAQIKYWLRTFGELISAFQGRAEILQPFARVDVWSQDDGRKMKPSIVQNLSCHIPRTVMNSTSLYIYQVYPRVTCLYAKVQVYLLRRHISYMLVVR